MLYTCNLLTEYTDTQLSIIFFISRNIFYTDTLTYTVHHKRISSGTFKKITCLIFLCLPYTFYFQRFKLLGYLAR